MHGYKILDGGDLNENGNAKKGKLVMHGYKFYMEAILTKMTTVTRVNPSCIVTNFCKGRS